MSGHRFSVGQNVRLVTRIPRTASGHYEIMQLMPFDGRCFEYRIKNVEEQFFRIAKEHELNGEELVVSQDNDQP